MAASTANMVQSSSGKMYDASSSQGKMIRSKGGTQELKDDKKGIFASILESLQNQTSLLFQIDDNTEEGESATEKRNRRIKEENTDPKEKGTGIFSKIGSGIKATGGALQKMNPFSGGIGTKMGILLLTGLLYAITQFGDKLIKPLASVLEMIDKEGGFLDKFKDTDFFKGAAATFERIKQRAMEIDEDIRKLLAGVTSVVNTIKKAYKAVEDYILQFDTDGDGSLDEAERELLYTDLKDKASTYIMDFFKGTMQSIGGMLLSAVFIKQTALLAFAAIKPIFAKVAAGSTLTAAAGAASTGAMLLPIAGLLLYGVTTTWSNISDSIKTTIEEEGSVSFSGFFANFFGGDDKGGFMNAMRQAFKIGGTFALVGMGIGAVLGGGIMSVPFALIGGLIGMGVGLLVGALAGSLGSDKIKSFTTKMGEMIGNTIDAIGDFFGNVIAGFKSFLKGDGFMSGYNDARYANKSKAESDLIDIQDEIAALEAKKTKLGKNFSMLDQKQLDKKIAKADDLEMTIADAPQHEINRNLRLKEEEQEKNAEVIENLEKQKAYNPGMFFEGSVKSKQLDTAIQQRSIIDSELRRMPVYKDTLRTEIKLGEERIETERKAEILRKNNELYPSGSIGEILPQLVPVTNIIGGSSADQYINSNYGMSIGVDNDYSSVRVLGLDGFNFNR